MLRITMIAVLVAGVLSIPSTGGASPLKPMNPGSAFSTSPAGGSQLLDQEPVLVYNFRGLTFTGTLFTQLTVYNSGLASIARHDTVFFPPDEDLDVQVNSVTEQGAAQLLRSLSAAGAFVLQDPSEVFLDVPIHTVTVLRGATDALAHTFSYYSGVGEYAAVDDVISSFIAQTFPGF